MTLEELLMVLGLADKEIKVTIIKPIRHGEIYEKGTLIGFKSGIYGGGYSPNRKSFNSTKMKWIKRPKVHVLYNIAVIAGKGAGKMHTDWVDIDNCSFEIKDK